MICFDDGITNEITMTSDGTIKVNNLTGLFTINGFNSNLKSNEVDIYGGETSVGILS